ncbi:hypothetical protein CCH79_00020194 [Gambusia affinis]|uniref:THAP-type domain-containing protein n=1 Tax=Gambusia affinis TaxID=33528 RepID=A0A315V4P1_GAMAF|nr:hypothetical protein CCH79_00020194 [Gambusia affinis]
MAQSRRGCFSSVPTCSREARKQPYLSYHAVPSDPEQRRPSEETRVRTLRMKPGSTSVGSRHFSQEDFVSGSTTRRLKHGSVPSLFTWNSFSSPD